MSANRGGRPRLADPRTSHLHDVVIIDDDLGFVVWLGFTLAASGYPTIPATSCQAALGLIEEARLATIDLVVLDLALPGASDLIGALNSRGYSFNVISIEGSQVCSSPSGLESQWLSMVRKALDFPRQVCFAS